MKHFKDYFRRLRLRNILQDGQHIRRGFWRKIDDGRRKVWVKATKVSNPVQNIEVLKMESSYLSAPAKRRSS